MNHRHPLRLIGVQKGPRGHLGNRDLAADRREHRGIADVDLSGGEVRASRLNGGLGRFHAGLSRVIGLLGNGVRLHEGRGTGSIGAGERELSLGLIERRLGASLGSLVGRGIDLIEGLAFLHVLAFGEEALLQHAAHLRTDLGHTIGHGAARDLLVHLNRPDGHSLDRHVHGPRRSSLRVALLLAAAGDGNGCDDGERENRAAGSLSNVHENSSPKKRFCLLILSEFNQLVRSVLLVRLFRGAKTPVAKY